MSSSTTSSSNQTPTIEPEVILQDNNNNTNTNNNTTTSKDDTDRVVLIQNDDDNDNNNNNNNLKDGTSSAPMTSTTTSSTTKTTTHSLHSIRNSRTIGSLQSLSLLLNAGLMIYAHVGLSGVFVSNQPRIPSSTTTTTTNNNNNNYTNNNNNSTTIGNTSIPLNGSCTSTDLQLWNTGGWQNKSAQSNYCATQYRDSATGAACLLNTDCSAECFTTVYGYTSPCAACFGAIPYCSFLAGCAGICASQPTSTACADCTQSCNDIFTTCSGLPPTVVPPPNEGNTTQPPTPSPTVKNDTTVAGSVLSNDEICEAQQTNADYEDVSMYHVVYELTFYGGISSAWNGNARGLAVIVVLFSGIWPYTKNIILALAWYLPLTVQRRSSILLWLRRLGKYTLVDVYLVIVLIVGVMVEITVAGDVPVVIKGEPRFAIVAFLLATLWEFIHIEWMTHVHQSHLDGLPPKNNEDDDDNNNGEEDGPGEGTEDSTNTTPEGDIVKSLEFRSDLRSRDNPLVCKSPLLLQASVLFLLCLSLGLFLAGASLETVRFISFASGATQGCTRSYNLYSLGRALISGFSLHLNGSKPSVWTLFFSYIILLIALPLLVHSIQTLTSVIRLKNKNLCRTADATWTFASVDVYLLAVFVTQYKFSDMIASMAGRDGSQFFSMTADLGPGFYVLIAYSVIAGFFQYLFNRAVTGYYKTDVLTQIDYVWSFLFRCLLVEKTPDVNNDDNEMTKEQP